MAHVIAADMLNDYNAMTGRVKWWNMIARLGGFSDKDETYDPTDPQKKLEDYLKSVRAMPSDDYDEWKKNELLPLREFVTKYFYPSTYNKIPVDELEQFLFERRFSLLKLCVLIDHYESSNWRHFAGNEDRHPELMDCPQAVARFAGFCKIKGIDHWPEVRARCEKTHLECCREGGLFISKDYRGFPAGTTDEPMS